MPSRNELRQGVRVAVVIPFYQRDPGLLERALRSIYKQQVADLGSVHVIVVDDGSPVKPHAEVTAPPPPRFSIEIITKLNGGVSSARNAGLDAVPPETDYVAFLDSDDMWFEDHLQRAVQKLASGDTIYFSNCYDRGEITFLSYSPELAFVGNTTKMTTEEAFQLFLINWPFHISFSVFVFEKYKCIRFDQALHRASEDHLFFLRLFRKGGTICVNARCTGKRGGGVSIYRESLWWGSPLCYERVADQVYAVSQIRSAFGLVGDDRTSLERHQTEKLEELVFLGLRNVTRHGKPFIQSLWRVLRLEPRLIAVLPASVLKAITGHTGRRLLR